MPRGPTSTQAPDGLAGVAAGVAGLAPTPTVAETPDPEPTPTFADTLDPLIEAWTPAETPATDVPAETIVPIEPDPAATVAPTDAPRPDETLTPVAPEPAETVTPPDDPGVPGTLTVVDPDPVETLTPDEPVLDEPAPAVPLVLGDDADPPDDAEPPDAGAGAEAEPPDDPPAILPEARAMPPDPEDGATAVLEEPGPLWPTYGRWPG